jgi:hypothetical protein
LFPFVCFVIPGRLTTKEDVYPSNFRGSQNYLRRRKNKTIIETTKEMIHDQSLPMIMWAEACMTVVYVQNRSPHQILKNITLEEAFIGVKPEIGHFKIFGCPIYFHVPKENRSKLDPSGERVHLWDTVNLQRHIGSTSLVRDRLR